MDPSVNLEQLAAAKSHSRPRTKGAGDLVAMLAALALAAFATVTAFVWLVPERNDYALATLIKHERLAHASGHRIVLSGGSNLSFGIDSTIIERDTGCTAVNMGMNGYFGVRYLLSEVKVDVRPGDVVVLAFEWDNYFKSVDGSNTDLLVVVKANLSAIRYLTWKQRLGLLYTIPDVAQQKALSLIGRGLVEAHLVPAPAKMQERDWPTIEEIEGLSGFAPNGDLVSHLGVPWTSKREQGIDLTRNGIDPEVIGLIRQFTIDMNARGVAVVVSYTPVLREFYEQHAAVIEEVHRRLTHTPPIIAPRPPSDYVYDEPMFFDTVYHLNATGRPLRTRQLVGDLEQALGIGARCRAPAEKQSQLMIEDHGT